MVIDVRIKKNPGGRMAKNEVKSQTMDFKKVKNKLYSNKSAWRKD